ncbi:retropepsin-like aspartic protease [Flavobacterium selenitireducens]|uniref:retropepsin-like aspartic protease n=1 Tax=Flavobacterium selenitireducens TaxID=2722704 RepID=UPI00168A697C|nr:retropepsin-like aspartic protease [Flavobacterium selenitireducens]MBD3581869.1 clan AA aspartic protease [Flavobacterium selenitireducens]
MHQIDEILDKDHYRKIRFKISKTQHLLLSASINGVKGDFILDTGASNSCVGFEETELFKLITENSKTKAAGAGAIDMFTQAAHKNLLKIGRWTYDDFNLVVFDLSHVNTALEQHKAKRVQGIIGADVLIHGKAIIDYASQTLYLKKHV